MSSQRRGRASILSWIDNNWPLFTFLLVGGGVAAAVSSWTVVADGPVFVAKLNQPTRSVLYGSIGTTAGALLGLTIASLAILLTLDEGRPSVKEMRSLRAWPILHHTFLAAAAFFMLTLALSTLALGIDSGPRGSERLEIAVVTLATVALAELFVAGVAFALVVRNLTRR